MKVLVPDFIAIAGSFVRDPQVAGDVDVVVRASYNEQTREFSLPAESLMLLIRNAIREKFGIDELGIHLIFNPTGPHSDYIPVGDLILRFKDQYDVREVKEAKEATAEPLRLVFLGTGPAEPIIGDDSEDRDNTATLVMLGDSALLVDAPSGVAAKLQERNVVPTAVLITHRHSDAVSGIDELTDVPIFGPEKIGSVPMTVVSQPFTVGPFTVTPIPIAHSDVPTFGYRISAGVGYPTILVVHDIAELNDRLLSNMGDVVVFDGAGWGREIGRGHIDVLEAIPLLKAHGASRVYLTQISRLVPEGAERQLPPDVFIAHDGMEVTLEREQKETVPADNSLAAAVLSKIDGSDETKARLPWPTKPAVPFYFEHFSPNQLWETWGKEHVPFFVEPKWNGWRVMIDGIAGKAVTESGMDVSRVVPKDLFIDGAVLDGELMFEHDGKLVPRNQIAAITGGTIPRWTPALKIFDVLVYDGKPIGSQPYKDRRAILERIVPSRYLSPAVEVTSLEELKEAFQKMGLREGSEGIVAKSAKSVAVAGGTNEWSKVKLLLEVVVEVVSVEKKKNGFAYQCRWKDGTETGKTMVTQLEAKPGDTLTVVVQELVPVNGSLHFQNAVVTGVNERPAMTIDEARRVMHRAQEARKWFYGGAMPFTGIGMKSRMARLITAYTPEHTRYVEPFVGPGGYFFLRPKVAGIKEIISDIDPRKHLAYKALQRRPDVIADIVARAKQSPVGGKAQRGELRQAKPKSQAEALLVALRLRMHTQRGFDSEYSGLVHRQRVARPDPGTYYVASLRLHRVTVLNDNAMTIIKRYDSPDTFFYLDPPYPVEGDDYRFRWTVDDFVQLLRLLKGIKGKFMLSCTPETLRAARKAGESIPKDWKVVRYKNRILTQSGPKLNMEYLVMNYRVKSGSWLRSVKGRIIELPHVKAFSARNWREVYNEWIKKIDDAMRGGVKALPEESLVDYDEPTRSEAAKSTWERMWQQYYPESGFGRFVVQRHIRGISEGEKDSSLDDLARKHSVHLDIRFTAGNGEKLFGFTVFIPEGSETDALRDLAAGKPFQCSPKLPQPTGWLDVGVGKPRWSEPGDVGATSRKYAVFEAVDSGRYSAGVWNRHSAEIVLMGKTLKGRFIFQQIKPGTWVVRKVTAEPIARRMSVEQISGRLAKRGHREFIYRDPASSDKPKIIQIQNRKEIAPAYPGAANAWTVYIALVSHLTKRTPWIRMISDSWAIVPVTNAFADLTGDIVPSDEIKKIAAQKPKVPLLLAHSKNVPLGEIVDYRRVGRFLFGVAKLNSLGKKVLRFISRHPTHQIAPLGWGTSIGFRAQRETGGDKKPSVLHDVQLLEVSILPVGQIANPWTGVAVEE